MNLNVLDTFEVMNASVIGTDHRVVGRPNQDAVYCLFDKEMIIVVLCDGCSESPHSEIGSILGSKIIAHALFLHAYGQADGWFPFTPREVWWRWNALKTPSIMNTVLKNAQHTALGKIGEISSVIESGSEKVFWSYFLFTTIGIMVTPVWSMVFALGDGMFAVNGEVQRIDPFPDNKPPYLAYAGLVRSRFPDSDSLRLSPLRILPTNDVMSLCVGTDGAWDLVQAKDNLIPRTGEPVGDISQFWEKDVYFTNPMAGTKRLALMNRAVVRPNWEERVLTHREGLLPDDTTLAVVRRKKREG